MISTILFADIKTGKISFTNKASWDEGQAKRNTISTSTYNASWVGPQQRECEKHFTYNASWVGPQQRECEKHFYVQRKLGCRSCPLRMRANNTKYCCNSTKMIYVKPSLCYYFGIYMPCCLYYRLKVSRSFLTQPAPRLETTGTPEGWDASFLIVYHI